MLCGLYYIVWVHVLPRIKGYELRPERLTLENGEGSHRLAKVPRHEIAEWDQTHDATGAKIGSEQSSESGQRVDYVYKHDKA